MDRAVKMALGSVAIGLAVLGLKFQAYRLTGSVALYSDALESIINVVAAGAALLALTVSTRPADANHPYGHDKAEYFSAVLEGVLIVLAALAILREAWAGFLEPRPLDAPVAGLALNALASLINGVWSWLLIRRGRRWRSPAAGSRPRPLSSACARRPCRSTSTWPPTVAATLPTARASR